MFLNSAIGNLLVLMGAIISLTYLNFIVKQRNLSELYYRAWTLNETSVYVNDFSIAVDMNEGIISKFKAKSEADPALTLS